MSASRTQVTVDTSLGVVTVVTRDDEIYTTHKVFLREQDSQGISDTFLGEATLFVSGDYEIRGAVGNREKLVTVLAELKDVNVALGS